MNQKIEKCLKFGIFLCVLTYVIIFVTIQSSLSANDSFKSQFEVINCDLSLSNNYNQTCVHSNTDVYLPFSFLSSKFDLSSRQTKDKYQLLYSSSQVELPHDKYNPFGEYLWFKKSTVELRNRVKYVSGMYGVPITSQWSPNGHIYPIQVAQFGLSYLSKYSSSKNNSKTKKIPLKPSKNANVRRLNDGLEFDIGEKYEKFSFKLNKINYESYFTAVVSTNDTLSIRFHVKINDKHNYLITYDASIHKIDYLKVSNYTKTAKYSIAGFKLPFKLYRNILIDTCKAFQLNCSKQGDDEKLKIQIVSIDFSGKGSIKNAFMVNRPYLEIAMQAGDYFIKSQNSTTGGWPTQVKRKFDKSSGLYVQDKWYSAMAQGQAISLLVRLYYETRNNEYLESAKRAVRLFRVNVTDGGVRSYFMEKYVWYEEYPTFSTRLYVLNGFIYSLFGLYDLKSVLEELNDTQSEIYKQTSEFYLNGIESLLKIISMYDTGSRTFYDLRHIENENTQPNIARWDYHQLHVSLVKFLNTILKSKKLDRIAKRWLDYSNGIWSKHN